MYEDLTRRLEEEVYMHIPMRKLVPRNIDGQEAVVAIRRLEGTLAAIEMWMWATRDARELVARQHDKIKLLERQNMHLRIQAQIWACEARAQKATANECLQAASGETGELGDWNGSGPVREEFAKLRERK